MKLDERLAQDSQLVAKLPLCQLRLMNDARFPWLLLIPRREGASEIFDLNEVDQQRLWHEASVVGQMLKTLTQADKINVASLGNVVAQLHVHVVARRHDDAAWPGPVWGHGEGQPYAPDRLEDMHHSLLVELEKLQPLL